MSAADRPPFMLDRSTETSELMAWRRLDELEARDQLRRLVARVDAGDLEHTGPIGPDFGRVAAAHRSRWYQAPQP